MGGGGGGVFWGGKKKKMCECEGDIFWRLLEMEGGGGYSFNYRFTIGTLENVPILNYRVKKDKKKWLKL